MLRAIPRGLFSWGFAILEDDAEVAGLEVAWMRERGRLPGFICFWIPLRTFARTV